MHTKKQIEERLTILRHNAEKFPDPTKRAMFAIMSGEALDVVVANVARGNLGVAVVMTAQLEGIQVAAGIRSPESLNWPRWAGLFSDVAESPTTTFRLPFVCAACGKAIMALTCRRDGDRFLVPMHEYNFTVLDSERISPRVPFAFMFEHTEMDMESSAVTVHLHPIRLCPHDVTSEVIACIRTLLVASGWTLESAVDRDDSQSEGTAIDAEWEGRHMVTPGKNPPCVRSAKR